MSDEINATDAALKLAEEHELDLTLVVGTGADGRVTKPDVEAHLAALEPKPEEPEAEPEAEPEVDAGPVERAHALAADVTAYMRDDPTAAEIAALPNLGAIINWAGDREKYADELRARAQELLNA